MLSRSWNAGMHRPLSNKPLLTPYTLERAAELRQRRVEGQWVPEGPLILAVDDEPAILRLLRLELTAQGFRIITASGGEEALDLATAEQPDLVLLDVAMPGMSGLVVLSRIREYSTVPIFLMSARDTESAITEGMRRGADDYIVKPFVAAALGERLRGVLRRGRVDGHQALVRAGAIEVDLVAHTVTRAGARVGLTHTEWLLLQQLAANAGDVVPSVELLAAVWGPEYRDELAYLGAWIGQLRAKLEASPADPQIIQTASDAGYVLIESPAEHAREGS